MAAARSTTSEASTIACVKCAESAVTATKLAKDVSETAKRAMAEVHACTAAAKEIFPCMFTCRVIYIWIVSFLFTSETCPSYLHLDRILPLSSHSHDAHAREGCGHLGKGRE